MSTREKGRREGVSTSCVSSLTQVFLHFLSILSGCWVHLLSPIFSLPKFAHVGLPRGQRFTKSNHWILPILRMGASSTHSMHCPTRRSIIGRSALVRCKKPIIRSRKDQPRTRTTTTTTDHTTPHHTHPTTRGTRHDTAPHSKNKDTHVHAHAYVYTHV